MLSSFSTFTIRLGLGDIFDARAGGYFFRDGNISFFPFFSCLPWSPSRDDTVKLKEVDALSRLAMHAYSFITQ